MKQKIKKNTTPLTPQERQLFRECEAILLEDKEKTIFFVTTLKEIARIRKTSFEIELDRFLGKFPESATK